MIKSCEADTKNWQIGSVSCYYVLTKFGNGNTGYSLAPYASEIDASFKLAFSGRSYLLKYTKTIELITVS